MASYNFFYEADAVIFNDFISRAGLHDFPLGARRFTRFSKSGLKMSKLDRFLVTTNYFNNWNDASIVVLDRVISDHSPIRLKVGTNDFGPKTEMLNLQINIYLIDTLCQSYQRDINL